MACIMMVKFYVVYNESECQELMPIQVLEVEICLDLGFSFMN